MTKTAPPEPKTKCGVVCIIGAPNAGKSTFLNAMVGSKLSIVTYKPQTTRTRIVGIMTVDEAETQIIFIDTPGIFKPKIRLERSMVQAAWHSINEADRVLLLADVSGAHLNDETLAIIEHLKLKKAHVHLVMNKVDLVDKMRLLKLAEFAAKQDIFDEIFMVSALKGTGLADVKKKLISEMPNAPFMYPADQLSEMPERLLAAEVTREQIFFQMKDELPYHMTVETESWQARDDGSVLVGQVIYVSRENHKAMVLGKGGDRIKRIGEKARKELIEILGCPIHLKLFVKLREDWMDDPERYRPWGLDFKA
jgi:GTP-binding protein Era